MASLTGPVSRRALVKLGVVSWVTWALSGCQSARPAQAPTPAPAPAAKSTALTLVLATSELVVGPNRFAVGIIDEANKPIVDAQVTFGFFQVNGQEATKRAEAVATFRWVEEQARGIYTAPVQFDAPGRWGVETSITRGGQRQVIRSPFDVKATGMAPMIGSSAIRSKTATERDVKDLSEICTAAPPCPLHAISLDEALANGKPTAVLFASPGYCSSQTCAPQLGVLLGVQATYAATVNLIHVEIYKDPRNQVLADAVTEWRLPSEPWMFFVDRTGTIVERFDGIATAEEIGAGMDRIG